MLNAFPHFPIPGNHLVLCMEQGGTWSEVPASRPSVTVAVAEGVPLPWKEALWGCTPPNGLLWQHITWPCGHGQQRVTLSSQWDQFHSWCTSNSLHARHSSAAEMLEFSYFWSANPSGPSSYQITPLELCLSIFFY